LAATRPDKHGSYDVMTEDGLESCQTALNVSILTSFCRTIRRGLVVIHFVHIITP